jgi:hypothetical protein
MSDAKQQSAAQAAIPNQTLTGPAILSISFTKADGTTIGNPIRIEVPRVLSKKLVKMYLLEMIVKLVKATLDKVVADLGW